MTASDATQKRLRESLRDLRDVSDETFLLNLTGDVSEIVKSTLFEISLRHFIRRPTHTSEMYPCRLDDIIFVL